MGDDIVAARMEWMTTLQFLNSLNKTNVVLLPKCENPELMKDFRSISLCNVVYKILSKVLTNRLKGILSSLISKLHS